MSVKACFRLTTFDREEFLIYLVVNTNNLHVQYSLAFRPLLQRKFLAVTI